MGPSPDVPLAELKASGSARQDAYNAAGPQGRRDIVTLMRNHQHG